MSVLGFFSSLFRADSPRSDWVSNRDHWIVSRGGMRTDTGLYVSETLAMNLPVVYSCVGLISDVLATGKVRVVDVNEKAKRTEEVYGDPRSLMLNLRPNEYMTSFTQRQTTQAHTLLWGNGLCEIGRDNTGKAETLVPIPPGCVWPQEVKTSDGPEIRYRGTIGARQVDKPADEILHLRGLGYDGINGLSPISLARQAVGLGLATEKYGNKLFANDLRSGGFVSHPESLSPQAHENLKASLQAQAGLDNAHEVKILEEGMTYTANTINPDDAQFLGTREFTIAEFARMYRVPLELLQAQGKTSSWGSGIEQLFLAFLSFTLEPWATQWGQECSLKLLTTKELENGRRIVLDLEDMKSADSTARAAFYERLVNIKAMTPNEARAREGLNPIEGGDEVAEDAPPAPVGPKPPNNPERVRENDRFRKQEAA